MTLLLGTLNKYKWWIIAVVVIIAALWLYAGRKEKPPKEHKAQQKELQAQDQTTGKLIDALKQSMNQTDRLIELHERNTMMLYEQIQANHSAIEADKKQTDEDIKRVRTYSADDIKRFFSGLDDVPAK